MLDSDPTGLCRMAKLEMAAFRIHLEQPSFLSILIISLLVIMALSLSVYSQIARSAKRVNNFYIKNNKNYLFCSISP